MHGVLLQLTDFYVTKQTPDNVDSLWSFYFFVFLHLCDKVG